MANVPSVPTPTVAPSTAPESGNAPALAFGANVIGEGLGLLGKSAEHVSEVFTAHAEKQAALDNKLNADTAAMAAADKQQNLILEYQKANQGVRAEPNLPAAFKDLEAIRTEGGAALMSPAARDLYNSQTRINTFEATRHLAGFAASEGLRFRNDQADSLRDNTIRGATPENFDAVAKSLGEIGATKAGINGWDDTIAKNWVQDSLGKAVYNVGAGLAPHDPAAARAFAKAHDAALDPQQRTQLDAVISSSEDNHLVSQVAADATNAALTGGATSAPTVPLRDLVTSNIPGAKITSEYRTPEQNAAVKGAMGSAHQIPGHAVDFTLGSEAAMVAAAAKLNQQPGVHAVYEGPGAAHSTAPHVHIQLTGAGGGGRASYENLLANAQTQYEAIAARPDLRGRQDLINKAQSQFMTDLGQRQALHNKTAVDAQNTILSAAGATGLTDIGKLQQQPGVMDAWMSLTPKEQLVTQNTLTAEGNKWDPAGIKEAEFHRIMGMQTTDTPGFLAINPSELDLPKPGRDAIFNAQLAIQKHDAKVAAHDLKLHAALNDPLVKVATERLSKKRMDVFIGAFDGELQQWENQHKGVPPTPVEYRKIANDLVAKHSVPGSGLFGLFPDQRPGYEVPAAWLKEVPPGQKKTREELLTDAYGRPPSAAETATAYARVSNAR